MIVEIGGGKGGFKEYLETGQKKGRELHRDQLDQRIPLAGDLNVFELATSAYAGTGRTYDHITLSFSENHISNELLETAVREWRDHSLAAWPEEDRHRIAFYAEAHRPKILSYANSETGEKVERLIHIHIGMGRHDLITGKAIEPLGYLGEEADNLKFIDAWQESFNTRLGLSSPKDNPKITPENAVDVLARYTGHKPDELGTFNEKKSALEITLQKEILAHDITTWDALGKLLAEHGEVTKMHEGRFDECYRIKPTGSGRAMRLKGVFFGRQFIERPTTEKLSIIQEKARVAYLEQMQPRKEPSYVANILQEWNTVKARENRLIHTGSPFYKNEYLPADAATRLQLLDQLERKHHAKPSVVSNDRSQKITTARTRVPGLPSRNMDGIQRRSEMLLRSDASMDVRTTSSGEQNRLGVRQTDGTTGGRGSDSASTDSQNSEGGRGGAANNRLWVAKANKRADEASGTGNHFLTQPSSVIEHMQATLLDRYEQAADKERYTEIRKNLNCAQLLARLSHSHGLNPDLYQVETAKDGTPRIQCGSRALSPSDFLMKELGMQWKEAAPILRTAYETQIGKQTIKPRFNKAAPSQLWKDFKAEQLPTKVELDRRLKAFDGAGKARRAVMAERLKAEQKRVLAGLAGDARKAAHALQKLHTATVKAEFKAMLQEERMVLRESIQPKNGWQLFLQKRAQQGDAEALLKLRKLDDSARSQPVAAVVGTINLDDEDEKSRIRRARDSSAAYLKMLAHTVELNGDIIYRQNGHAVLRDEGRNIAILDEHSTEAIAAALLIAREKFGNLTLTGSADFQQRTVAVAVAQGIACRFVDPQLEALRLRLIEEKRRPARAPAKTITKPVQQAQQGETPAVDAPALTCAGWLAQQPKELSEPRKSGDSEVEFGVAYVADGVVLDHGRTLALYPLPGFDLRPGQRLVISKDGSLVLAPERIDFGAGKGGPMGSGRQGR